MRRPLIAFSVLVGLGSSVTAQALDGLYKPSGTDWSCSPNDIGMDGGALAILDGYLEGVENRCNLTDPQPEGEATRYTTLCTGEGYTVRGSVTLKATANGVLVRRDGGSSYWVRCRPEDGTTAKLHSAAPSNSRWTFGGAQGVYEAATQDRYGNYIAFTCNDVGEDGGLFIELAGKPISGGAVTIDVDGRAFSMTAWAQGGDINTECRVCGDNYTALWEAVAAGRVMKVSSSDGRSASFNLDGSRAALGNEPCYPAGW